MMILPIYYIQGSIKLLKTTNTTISHETITIKYEANCY